jgi:serine protease inhibitor
MKKTLFFGTFGLLFLSACGGSEPTPQPTPTPVADTTAKVVKPVDKELALSSSNAAVVCPADSLNVSLDSSKTAAAVTSATIAEASNSLAINMLKVMAKTPDELKGNTFLSPYSVSMAFAMLYLGSAGESAAEIAKVMGWKENSAALHSALYQLSAELRAQASDSTYTLGIANRIWANKTGFCIRPAYQQQATEFYRAAPLSLDFSQQAAAIKTINDWASDNTNGKIPELYSANSLDAATQIVLANAVYFKADWLLQFDKDATAQADFLAAEVSKVDFMNAMFKKSESLKYFKEPTFTALALPYKGNQLSMYVLLPNEKSDVNKLIASLNTKIIQKLVGTSGADFDKVNISLPKWTTKYSVEMTAKLLPALGMSKLFTSCDLSRMTNASGLQISSVLHKTFIAVDEKGTEAAAVTSIAITKSAPPMDEKIVNFVANRPFLYFIADNKTGTVLFVGNIAKP